MIETLKPPPPHLRKLRSFTLRGRITPAQRAALNHPQSAHWLLPTPQPTLLDNKQELENSNNPNSFFQKEQPLVLEIGFGMGENLIANSLKNPTMNWIGVEVHQSGVGKVLHHLLTHQQANDNLRVYRGDICDWLGIWQNCFEAILLLFPDPWPKKRQHKRRLIQTHFIKALVQSLQTQGVLFISTDSVSYGEHIEGVLNKVYQQGLLKKYHQTNPFHHLSKFEQKAKSQKRDTSHFHAIKT